MYVRTTLAAALLAAMGGTAAAQSLTAGIATISIAQPANPIPVWNQLVKVYPNAGGLGTVEGHYLLTIEVPMAKSEMKKLRNAIDNDLPDAAKKVAKDNLGSAHAKPTEDVLDLVLGSIDKATRGSPPDVDVQTIDDYAVQGSKVRAPKAGAKKLVASTHVLRIHLDVPITQQLQQLEDALNARNGCGANTIILANIAAAKQTPMIKAALKSALGC